jgi:hypothetical protein
MFHILIKSQPRCCSWHTAKLIKDQMNFVKGLIGYYLNHRSAKHHILTIWPYCSCCATNRASMANLVELEMSWTLNTMVIIFGCHIEGIWSLQLYYTARWNKKIVTALEKTGAVWIFACMDPLLLTAYWWLTWPDIGPNICLPMIEAYLWYRKFELLSLTLVLSCAQHQHQHVLVVVCQTNPSIPHLLMTTSSESLSLHNFSTRSSLKHVAHILVTVTPFFCQLFT